MEGDDTIGSGHSFYGHEATDFKRGRRRSKRRKQNQETDKRGGNCLKLRLQFSTAIKATRPLATRVGAH